MLRAAAAGRAVGPVGLPGGTLNSLGATSAAARGMLDYSSYSTVEGGAGLIRTPLPEGSFLRLKDVIALHRSNPELFAWCDGV